METKGTLNRLAMTGVGPVDHLEMDFRPRINLITGDNGLGKTFILDTAWWALCREAAGNELSPTKGAKVITNTTSSEGTPEEQSLIYQLTNVATWFPPAGSFSLKHPMLYAGANGSFATWDFMRTVSTIVTDRGDGSFSIAYHHSILFSPDQVWDGVTVESSNGKTEVLSNGLIDDWVFWQNSNESGVFDILTRVLSVLSPPEQGDLGELVPSKPIRLRNDARRIPTIKHSYSENVPLTQASSAVRRIVALAYQIVWTWEEHKIRSKLNDQEPQRNMIIFIDEIEAHLHPQWQRVILPALLEISDALGAELDIQFIITTHSPLVLTSLQPVYDERLDTVFHLDLNEERQVILEQPDVVFGSVESWLRSDFFEMGYPDSLPAEQAIDTAKQIMANSNGTVDRDAIIAASNRLARVLGAHEKFWIRWTYFAAQNGVEL